jgi:hypothetical protein
MGGVHEHHVGAAVPADSQGLGAVGRDPDHGEVGLGVQQGGEACTHDLLVVDHHDAHQRVGGHPVTLSWVSRAAGSVASTRKPPTGAEPARR